MNLCGEWRVALDVLKSNFALVGQQCVDARQCHLLASSMAKINTQRSAMGSKSFDVEYPEIVLACEAINRDQRKIREMLVVNGVELVFVYQPLEMGEFQRNHSPRRQKVRHSRG